jgi:phage tail-like protein
LQPAEIERLLPDIIARTVRPGNPLGALLDVMADLLSPSEDVLGQLDRYFDPYRTPERMVPYLAGWVDVAWLIAGSSDARPALYAPGSGWLREVVATAVDLSQWRGTAAGLVRFLETATGVAGFVVQDQSTPPEATLKPFHIRVVAPAAARPFQPVIERIVATQKPAYVTSELVFQSEAEPAPAPPST